GNARSGWCVAAASATCPACVTISSEACSIRKECRIASRLAPNTAPKRRAADSDRFLPRFWVGMGSLFIAEGERSGIPHLRGRILHVKSLALPENSLYGVWRPHRCDAAVRRPRGRGPRG